MTIYGNADDLDKNIQFHIWDGDKCNEYVEILEEITYQEGALLGSPLVPQPINVLNIVKKCIPLNRGFNWVSFNLNLGTGRNTFKNVLSSLKNKTGAYMKTDNNFAEYIGNGVWDALDSIIVPTKRYMLFVAARDTVCLRGTPYPSTQYPITIKTGWNWIGYIPSTGMTATQALRGLVPLNGDVIKSQTLFAQFVAGVGWIGNLNFIEPLKGYLLRISNAGTLTYPTGTNGNQLDGSQNTFTEKALAEQVSQEAPMTFDFTKYNSTMNLIGKINGIEITADDELRAFIDGKLVGVNKSIVNGKDRLFFETIYHDDQQNVSFKLYKADRDKEFELNRTVQFQAESLAGLVQDPIVFDVAKNTLNPVTISIEDQVISQPNKIFQGVSIPNGVVESGAGCTTFAFNSIPPAELETKPSCVAQTLEGNMSTVVKINYSELSSFVSANDVLTFVNPTTNVVVGCATFKETNNLFYCTVAGGTTSSRVPIDIKYYSSTMKKSFTLKGGIMYRNNDRVGGASAPYVVDISPLQISQNASGIVTAVMRDTSWTGKYCVNAFAMNCKGYNDGQTTFCFQRLKSGDCVDVIIRRESEIVNTSLKALKISSESIIKIGVNVEYKAGNIVELKPGFDSKLGTVFTGQIGGCANK